MEKKKALEKYRCGLNYNHVLFKEKKIWTGAHFNPLYVKLDLEELCIFYISANCIEQKKEQQWEQNQCPLWHQLFKVTLLPVRNVGRAFNL